MEDANEGGDEGGDASSDDDAHAADALAKDVSAKATVADADEPGAAAGRRDDQGDEAQAQEEAEERERDARIEEEKANAGPSNARMRKRSSARDCNRWGTPSPRSRRTGTACTDRWSTSSRSGA